MFYKFTAALAATLLAGSAAAGPLSPVAARSQDIVRRTPAPKVFHCDREFTDHTVYAGQCPALIDLDVDAGVGLELGLTLPKAVIKGDISIGLTDGFLLDPTIAIDLSGFEAYVEIVAKASAAAYASVALVAGAELELDIPGLLEVEVGAGLALDLLVGVSAAIELEAGFYLTFPKGTIVEVSLLTHEIVGGSLGGVIAKTLPIGLGLDVDLSAEIELHLGLRLRIGAEVEAEVDIIGVGAEAEVSIWINLFDYTQILIGSPECALSITESFELNVGVAVEVELEVAALELEIAPTVFVVVAVGPTNVICLPAIPSCNYCSGGEGGEGGEGGNGLPTPSQAPVTSSIPEGYVPTTIYETSTYTITQCAAYVPNCPASLTQHVTTSTVHSVVTVCPAGETGQTLPVPTTSAPPTNVVVPVPTATRTITLTECPAISSTFTPPVGVPTPTPDVVVPPPVYTPPVGVPSETPEVPEGPESPETPEVPEVPESPETPDVPEFPGVPETPAGPQPPVFSHPVPQPPIHSQPPPPVGGPSSSLPPLPNIPSVPTGTPSAPTPCVGCVGPATGVSVPTPPPVSPPQEQQPPAPEQPPVQPPSQAPPAPPAPPASPNTPPNTPVIAGAGRIASGAAGLMVVVGAVFALL